MTAAPTVALLGASGQLGSNLLTALAKQASAGKIKLVVLHRPTSDLSAVPADAEKRVLDAANASEAEIHAALKGVDILVSSTPGAAAGEPFLKALASLSPKLKAYVPSYFTANWTPAEETDPANVYIASKAALKKKAADLGIPVVAIHNGLFENSFFSKFAGVEAAENKLSLYGDALNAKFSFSSLPYIAEALAQIVTKPDLAGSQSYTIVEAEFTGQQLADEFAKLHGTKPTITAYTDADVAADRAEGPVKGLSAGWRKHWGSGNWTAPNRFDPAGITPRTLAQGVREAAAKA